MTLDQRHIVITGGTGQLGQGVASRLLDDGAHCWIPVFDERELGRFHQRDHERVHVTTDIDLTNAQQVHAFFETPASKGLWASVHLAGGFAMGSVADSSPDDFDAMMRMNALTCWLCCREAVRTMKKNPNGGRIVNVAARPALSPELGANMVPYAASKAAVAALTQALGAEVAEHGILVNAVAPSIIDTKTNRDAMPDADHEAWPTIDQIASTIAFLVSPENTVTRSSVVPVYGRS